MIDALSSKFKLNKDEVKQVFEQHHKERQAEHEKKIGERLQKLVDDGVITANQKSAIESKLAELKSNHETNKEKMEDLTPEQRKAKHDEMKADLESWAKDNNIDLSKLGGIFMGRQDGRHMRGHMAENREDNQ